MTSLSVDRSVTLVTGRGPARGRVAVIAFLLGPEAGYMTVQMNHVDGGVTP